MKLTTLSESNLPTRESFVETLSEGVEFMRSRHRSLTIMRTLGRYSVDLSGLKEYIGVEALGLKEGQHAGNNTSQKKEGGEFL